jgi:hypothetical protein
MCLRPSGCRLLTSLLGETFWWRGWFDNLASPLLLKDCMREACHDVLNGGVLHFDVLGGPECLFALLEKKRFWSGGRRKR